MAHIKRTGISIRSTMREPKIVYVVDGLTLFKVYLIGETNESFKLVVDSHGELLVVQEIFTDVDEALRRVLSNRRKMK